MRPLAHRRGTAPDGAARPTRRPPPLLAALGVLAALAAPAPAQYQTLDVAGAAREGAGFVTNIPPEAFTAEGIRLELRKGAAYTLSSKELLAGEYSLDVQFDLTRPSQKGGFTIELSLVNDAQRRKAVATYTDKGPTAGRTGSLSYFKDDKPQSVRFGNATVTASPLRNIGPRGVEWLRLHKTGRRVFFLQRNRGNAGGWNGMAEYPPTTYFQEDADAYQVLLTVRGDADFDGALLLSTLRLSGPSLRPRDAANRTFLFDFGPLEQDVEESFTPVSDYSLYDPRSGYGFVIPEMEKVWRASDAPLPMVDDATIAAAGLAPLPADTAEWYKAGIRSAYWCQLNDRRVLYATTTGSDWIEFFQRWIDLKTPLERDYVGLARPYQFAFDPLQRRDIDERRGALYVGDDVPGEFVVDLPNGRYNLILGVGWSGSGVASGEYSAFHVEIEGRVRKKGVTPNWRRVLQHPIRNVEVTDGQMNLRFFGDVRKAMNNYHTAGVGVGWHVNYLLILPAEQRELMDEWEWHIIRKRGEKIRKVTFVEGQPPQFRNENGFVSLNGKPFHFVKIMGNFHPGATEYYPYYCLGSLLQASHAFSGSQHFFKPDWEKLSFSDDYPWDLIDRLNVTYDWRFLSDLHDNNVLSFVPRAVSGEGTPTMDHRGRQNRYNVQPPLNSALGHEIQKEAFTMMANQIGLHPAVAGHFIYEELWHPNEAGYDDQSMLQYWGWLKNKYGTIEALNAEWGSRFAGFDEILPPAPNSRDFWEFRPEWVNFRCFRSWAQLQMVRTACELVGRLEPGHLRLGAKGDYATQTWYPGEYLDLFGWYTPALAASVARHFGKTPVTAGYLLNCEHAYVDGRRQVDHKPGPRRYMGRDDNSLYNRLVSSAFRGAKGFWAEWYTNGMCHAFHRADFLKREAPKYKIIHWTGQLAFFEPEAFEGPPVQLERCAAQASAANQMFFRLAPLWLPAKPLQPRVLLALTEPGCFLQFFGDKPYADLEPVSLRMLRSTNLPVDVMHLPYVPDLSAYKLIVLAETSSAISRADVERLRKFVAGGGKLILANGGGFSDTALPRRYTGDRDKDAVFPLEALADLGGYDLRAGNPYHMSLGTVQARWVRTDLAPDLPDGQVLGSWETDHTYKARPGSTVFLAGTLEKGGTAVDLGLLNRDRSVAVIRMPGKGAGDDVIHPLAVFFRRLIDSWALDDRVVLGGVDDAWNAYAGCLVGDGYTLAAVCNTHPSEPLETSLRLKILPPGQYAVTDVTGLRPELARKADGGLTIKPDPHAARMAIQTTLSAEQWANEGLRCQVPPMQSRILLIRPAADKVWVSIWKPTLTWFVRQPLAIAYGTAPADQAGAEALRAALAQVGVTAQTLPANEVKTRKERREVRINPNYADRRPKEDTSGWYLLDVFENELVDDERNLIVVGSEGTNVLTKRLTAPGTFAYDKSAEKITADYPGPGRGVIGMVEGITSAVFDPRSQNRDALLVGGSDEAGTTAAVARLAELIGRHCQKPPAVTTAPAGPADRQP